MSRTTGVSELPRGFPRLSLHQAVDSLRNQAARLRSGKLEPSRFARSVGVGVAIGFLPIHGLQSVATAGLVVIAPIDPLLTWLCTWVGNAVTAVPMMWCELQLGTLILSGHFRELNLRILDRPEEIGALGTELLIGSLVLALTAGAFAYLCAIHWAEKRHNATIAQQAELPRCDSQLQTAKPR